MDDNAIRHIGTGNTSRLAINSNGNIGFGASGIQTRLTIDSETTKFITLKRSENTKNAHIGYGIANNGGIYLGTDDSQYSLWVQQNGDVGIGTFNPDAKLAVDGTIHTKEVKVDLNGWSDFVFENNYDL